MKTIAGLTLALALLASPLVLAQSAASEEGESVKVMRGPGGKKTYVWKKGFVLVGTRHKPNVVYLIERARITYDWAAMQQSFVGQITRSVQRGPF